jgi:hypothetical protein
MIIALQQALVLPALDAGNRLTPAARPIDRV